MSVNPLDISVAEIKKKIEDNIKQGLTKKDRKRIAEGLVEGINEADKIFYLGLTKDALDILDFLLEMITSLEDYANSLRNEIAKIHYEIGMINSHIGNNDIAEEHFSKVLDIPKENFRKGLFTRAWGSKLVDIEYQKIYIDILNESAISYRRRRQEDSFKVCKELAIKANEEAKVIKYIEGEIKSLNILAMLEMYEGSTDQFLKLANKSEKLILKSKKDNYNLLGEIYSLKFTLYFNQGDNQLALEYCNMAETNFRKSSNNLELPNTLRFKAEILKNQGDYTQSKLIFELIINEYKHLISESNLVITYLSLGNLYFEIGEIDNALKCYNDVLKMRPEKNQGRAMGLSGIAKILHFQGELIKAEEYYKEAIAIYESLPFRAEGSVGALDSYFKLVIDKYEFEENNEKYLIEAEQILQKLNKDLDKDSMISSKLLYYLAYALLEKTRGNLYTAIEYISKVEDFVQANFDIDQRSLVYIKLLTAEIELERFSLKRRKVFFENAINHISSAEKIAISAGLYTSLIDIKLVQAELAIAHINWDLALSHLEEALTICKDKQLTNFIKNFESRILYVKAAKEEQKDRPSIINVLEAIRSLRYAQGLPLKEQLEDIQIKAEDFIFALYYMDSRHGTKLKASLIPYTIGIELKNLDVILAHQGTLSMVLLGQGDTYSDGLYLLPCSREFGDRDKFVYGTTIENPTDPELRDNKGAYCISELIFMKNQSLLLVTKKDQIEEIFRTEFAKITSIEQLTEDFLTTIRDRILNLLT